MHKIIKFHYRLYSFFYSIPIFIFHFIPARPFEHQQILIFQKNSSYNPVYGSENSYFSIEPIHYIRG